MAYYSLHAYDADVWMPSFAGLGQSAEMASNLQYAFNAVNVETPRGVLQPMAAPEILADEFNAKIETLASFHRRWYTGTGSKDWMVVATAGKLYCKQSGSTGSWTQLPFPGGTTSWTSNVWSWVTYEDSGEDVLLMSNADDGMIMVKPGSPWTVTKVTTPHNFGVIERYAERIWGGAITNEPDLLVYSRPYDPTNWTIAQQGEQPEDGAGDIQQPSWDGDSFTALKAFGNQLLAFKQHRVWRVLGTDPGEYSFKEQFGGGTAYPNTIAIDGERILTIEKDGMSAYDGLTVSPFNRPSIERFWKTVNTAALDQACAVKFKQRYYLAIPTGSSSVNNTLLVFNIEEGTFLVYSNIYIESMLATDEVLYATSSTLPGKIMVIHYNSWETGQAWNEPARWETPWIDFGRKTIAKGGYEIYFSPEVKGAPVVFRFTIKNEKKSKSKLVTVAPTTFKAKQKRIRFGGTSRRFKLIIETLRGPTFATWRFLGGIQMVVETDPD